MNDSTKLYPGQFVSYWVNYRKKGAVGGWERQYLTGKISQLNRGKTVWISRRSNPLWGLRELVPIERITPMEFRR